MTAAISHTHRIEPTSGKAPRHLVILLHGYGSNGADMIALAPLWRPALSDALFLAPDAPERCFESAGGYQWWALADRGRAALAAGARRAAPALDCFIDAQMAEYGLAEDHVLLVGFSQGTMMALHVGLQRERPFAGIIGYSGMLADPTGLSGHVRSRPPVLLIHGDADPVVPAAALQEARNELHRLGFEVEAHVRPGLPHMVDPEGLELGRRFAERVLRGD